MHTDELWQVFRENGEPIIGKGALDDEFIDSPSMVMGNAHVWFYRRSASGRDILLQRRSLTKKTSPGYYHVSAAGHINVDESPIEAAVRETKEEVGMVIDPMLLYLVQVTRSLRYLESLLYVYIYECDGSEEFFFDDGEVDEVKWVSLEKFYEMTENAASHMLIDMGRAYFDPLIAAIARQAV